MEPEKSGLQFAFVVGPREPMKLTKDTVETGKLAETRHSRHADGGRRSWRAAGDRGEHAVIEKHRRNAALLQVAETSSYTGQSETVGLVAVEVSEKLLILCPTIFWRTIR